MSELGNLNADGATEPTLAEILADLDKFTFFSTRLLVDGSGVTQPVSGTFWPAIQPISGSISVSNFPATYPVTGPLTDAELRATAVPITGTVAIIPGSTGVASVSRIAVNNTGAVTLSLSNAAKTQVIIYNEGGTLFVKFGANASLTDNTYVLSANSTVEINGYYGLITARKASGSTFVDVTEVGI